MSTPSESGSSEFELDLDLHFLPAWAQKPPAENKYANFQGGDSDSRPRRGGGGGGGGFGRGRDQGSRPGGNRPPPRRDGPRPGGGEGRPGGRFEGRRDGGGRPGGHFQEERREPAPPPLEVAVNVVPEEKGVESLARQIRLTGRAYPLFDIAALVLKRPDRYTVRFNVIKKADGKVAQPLFVCGLDDTLWLSEQEAIDYVLNKHFATFYQADKIPSDPPKGTYTFVAQCGISGTVLGPPNYHDYQNKLRKLHAERFARMPFEGYKARIRIVREEAVVKKWLEDQSFKFEYTCLNVAEPLKLTTREEVDRHFRETHLANVVKPVEDITMTGQAAMSLPCRPLANLARRTVEDQTRFPLKVVNVLSQQFAGHGLQFFKVNKTVTHVAVSRPRFLDMNSTPVSEGIRQIVEFIEHTSNCTRRKLFEALAPSAPLQTAEPAADPAAPAAATPPTPEAAALVSDLHWLIHQGHIIEFASGLIELAKRPAPRPERKEQPKRENRPAGGEKPAEESAGEVTGGAPAPESVPAAPEAAPSGGDTAPVAESAPAAEVTPAAEAPADPPAA